MTTETKKRYIVEVVVDEEGVTDSPYWPLASRGRTEEAAIAMLVAAEIQASLEKLGYTNKVEVTESYD